VEDAGVDISYQGASGSLIAQLTSVDQSGDYSFEVPIKDPAETNHMSTNTYPWSLQDGTNTILHLKNTTGKAVAVTTQFRSAGGSYTPDRLQLQPYQTLAIDVQKLKESGQKDTTGHTFPAAAASGQVEWSEETYLA
jgi:hypothetical protein